MKKIVLVSLSLVILSSALLIGLFVYSNPGEEKSASIEKQKTEETTKKDVREAVWEQLNTKQREWIGGTWEDGTVTKDTVGEGYISYKPGVDTESYQGKEVYVVSFDNGLTGMFALADIATYEIIGYFPYD